MIPGVLHITYIKNFGAVFGVMSGFGALRWILLILLIAFTALMVFAFIKGYFRTGFIKLSGALLLAGLLGNGIDRAIYGYVPDIFEFEFVKFAIFNLADVLVLVGGILFVAAILTGGLRRADEYDDYEEAPVRASRRREYDDEPAPRRAPRTAAEEAPVRRAAPSARGTTAPSPARQRAAGHGVPAAQPRAKRVIDENSVPVPVRPAARPAVPVQRAAETQRTAAPQRAAEPVRRAAAAPSAAVSRADLAAQNEATVRTVARPAASARPAAPKAAPAPAPVRETPKAAPAPAKEAPKAAPPEEFDLDSILAEFK